MALKKEMILEDKQVGYFMISIFITNKALNLTHAVVWGYENKAARDLNIKDTKFKKDYCLKECKYTLSDWYDYLKTLPEYKDAEDC